MEISAGGIVLGRRDGLRVALVEKHNGEWVLPKGHVEAAESLEAAALREIGQETGLWSELNCLEHIGAWPYNEYDPSRHSEKLNHFFVMEYVGANLPELRTDRAHKSAAWHPIPPEGIELAYRYQKAAIATAIGRYWSLKGTF